jgi:hypothetical protein
VNLDGYHGTGRVLVVRGRRGWAGILLGYVWWIELAVAVAVAAWATAASYEPARPVLSILFGALTLLLVLSLLVLITGLGMVAAHLKGRDGGSGVPLAELSPEGVRVRYRLVRARERRRGVPDAPAYDLAAPWSAIGGWRHGRGPFGEPVLVLDITGLAKVVRHDRGRRSTETSYAGRLEAAAQTPLAVRAPRAARRDIEAVRRMLAEHGVEERLPA